MTFEIENLTKKFFNNENKESVTLKNINLTIESGKFVCFLGPSGCGKTTLLRLMEGFENPTEGTIKHDGEIVTKPSNDRGFIFQEYSLFPWLNVIDNVTFGLKIAGQNNEESKKKALKYLETVGLKNFAYNYPHELSGGMKQRVAIIRSMINQSKTLLMDEPFSALDIQTKMNLQEQLVEDWKKIDRTIILVTHDVEEAVYLADKIVIFSKRPGTIKKIIDNNLPRPRDRESSDFYELVHEAKKYIDKIEDI